MSNDAHDDEPTKPDLPSGLGNGEEPTNPGVGTGEGYVSVTAQARRALAALSALEQSCPPPGAVGRRRYLEVLANGWGDVGMLCFDTRRITLELQREEEETP